MATWSVIAHGDSFCSGIDVLQNTNFGAASPISAVVSIIGGEKAGWSRAYMNFDTSAFPSTSGDIVSAKLVLDLVDVNDPGEQVNFDRIRGHDGGGTPDGSPADWVEDEITWIDYNTGNAWTESGGDFDTSYRVTFLVPLLAVATNIPGFKDMVVDAIDNRSDLLSVCALLDNEAASGDTRGIVFNSREDATGKPTLVIEYGTTSLPFEERGIGRGVSQGVGRGI